MESTSFLSSLNVPKTMMSVFKRLDNIVRIAGNADY